MYYLVKQQGTGKDRWQTGVYQGYDDHERMRKPPLQHASFFPPRLVVNPRIVFDCLSTYSKELPMLVLPRREGELIYIDNIVVKVLEVRGKRVWLAIEAPPTMQVVRAEVRQRPECPSREIPQRTPPMHNESEV